MPLDSFPRIRALATASAIVVGLSAPASLAEEPGAPSETPETLAMEGLQRLMQAMSLFMDQIPQYEAPEVLDNGDIIIRRKPSRPLPEEPPERDDSPGGVSEDTI